jgi:hypothetical protein
MRTAKFSSALLQCRGPERRATVWHLAAAVAIVALFVATVSWLQLPPPLR